MSLPYITPGAVSAAMPLVAELDYPLYDQDEAKTREILEAAGPHIARGVIEMFAAVFDRAATEAKLQPAIHNNIRVMIEAYGKGVGPQ